MRMLNVESKIAPRQTSEDLLSAWIFLAGPNGGKLTVFTDTETQWSHTDSFIELSFILREALKVFNILLAWQTSFYVESSLGNFLINANNPCLIPAFAAAIAADGLHGHAGGRRGRAGRRGGRLLGRRGRQDDLAAGGYVAPGDEAAGSYAAPSDDVPVYAGEEELGGYAADAAGDPALDMLLQSIPGVPGEDYPIYSEVPETAFSCDGQVDGGALNVEFNRKNAILAKSFCLLMIN